MKHSLGHFRVCRQRHIGYNAGQHYLVVRNAKYLAYLRDGCAPCRKLSGLPVQSGDILVAQDIGRVLVINNWRNFLTGSPFFTAAIRVKALKTKL